ncbi:hypothetical protein XF_1238 [Xylella fastidiosa 9a5c]|uniref:Uncharacterized protein n=1 Tax=Xylella fastidiosa (strain 9a5c) TaxID=160492 RepID=Q9PDZ0_XYLFA|nr:hypothetical protein XF_1238 [Xylella fastidiosa 9a5c]
MRRRCTNRVANYPPYAKQHAFHAMGATMRERLLINPEKRLCACHEAANTPHRPVS